MFTKILAEIDSMIARDPAARSRLEVALCYPALHAILGYRVTNAMWRRGWRLAPRLLSQFLRWMTGIEIHPGARIGARLFIDHGMGVVIGETAEIGDDVTLYHGVTLGGISPAEESDAQRNIKRHPTLEKFVIVGAGAQILGPVRIGENARIGANAVVAKDVPPGATMVGIPAKTLRRAEKDVSDFAPYGTPLGATDPNGQKIEGLMEQIALLNCRVAQLEETRRRKKQDAAAERQTAPRPDYEI